MYLPAPEIRSFYLYVDMDFKCLNCEQISKFSSFVRKFKNEYSEGGLTIYQSLHCPHCDSERYELVKK